MAKHITKSSIDWAKLEKLVPPEQMPNLMAFKAKNYAYLRRVLVNPEVPPAIDWEYYRQNIPIPGLVDNFKTAYSSFKVSYPEDKYSSEVDKQWESLKLEIKKYCDELQVQIDKSNEEVNRINALPKFDDMTMETFAELYPEQAVDFVKNPSFWPHTPDEQIGYKDPTIKIEH